MKRFVVVVALLITVLQSRATHLVGGEMTYIRLGGNTIRVTLTIYRDNVNGSAGAPLDAPAVVSFFNDNNVFLEAREITLTSSEFIQPQLNACQDEMPNIETEKGTYTFDVNLNTLRGYNPTLGVTLVYGRCCRNGIINNLYDPGAQGFSAIVRIPPASLTNNSPVFNTFEQYLCAGRYNHLNFSATDTDGDSLVYHLCDPLLGLGNDDCFSHNPNCPAAIADWLNNGNIYNNYGPPYNTGIWETGYSANQPFGINTTTLNPHTGIMEVNQPFTGVYVMRVCVSEYRNGVYLSTVSRDFQYLVTQCDFPDITIATDPNIPKDPATGLYTIDAKCNGGNINFNLASNAGIVSYHWDFGDPITTTDVSTQPTPTYIYSDTGSYIVTVIGYAADGCADTARGLVTFYPVFNPDFTFPNTACESTTLQFSDISTTTFGAVSAWEWHFGTGATSFTQNPTYTYTQPGSYQVRAIISTSEGCIDTVIKQLNVLPAPDAAVNLSNICLYDTLPVQNIVSGHVSYSWNFGDGTGSNDYTPIKVYNISGTFNVTHTVVGTNGCQNTAQYPITVFPLPNVYISNDTTICPNSSLQIGAGGGGRYSWTPPTYLDNPFSNVVTTTPSTDIQYTVEVTDAYGCKNKDSIQITLFPSPVIDAGIDTSVCLNAGSLRDSVRLQASGSVISYIWSPTAGLDNPNISSPLSRPTQNMTYYVTGIDDNGCSAIDSIRVYFLDPNLSLILEDSKAICRYDTTTLTVLEQGSSVYFWSPATGLSNPTANTPLFFPLDTTSYIFTVQNYCYQKSDTTTIIVHPLPTINTGRLDSVCIGDSTQLNLSGASIYRWDYSPTLSDSTVADPFVFPTTTTTYYVTGTDSFGCSNRDSITVFVYFPPVTNVLPDTAFICLGTTVQLNATGGVRYLWTQNNETLNDTTISNPIAFPQDTTTFHVIVTNIHNCSAEDSIKINVQLAVVPQANSPYDVCEGHSVQLNASGGLYYSWNPPTYLNSTNIPNPQAKPDESVVYTVTVSNDCFSETISVEVIIRPTPTADAGQDTTIFRNTSAQLQAVSNTITHYWFPNDNLSDPLLLDAQANPLFSQTYYLFVESEYGCTNTDSVRITVEPHTVILVPSGFSPNGDGTNDIFRIAQPMLNVQRIDEFAVFNRWGEKVFSTTDPNGGWNGIYKDKLQPAGAYTWYIRAVTFDNERVFKSGNITLVR